MMASHHKQKAVGPILKNQANVQSDPEFKKIPSQLANVQPAMPVRMAKIPLQLLQSQPYFRARFFGMLSNAMAERLA